MWVIIAQNEILKNVGRNGRFWKNENLFVTIELEVSKCMRKYVSKRLMTGLCSINEPSNNHQFNWKFQHLLIGSSDGRTKYHLLINLSISPTPSQSILLYTLCFLFIVPLARSLSLSPLSLSSLSLLSLSFTLSFMCVYLYWNACVHVRVSFNSRKLFNSIFNLIMY